MSRVRKTIYVDGGAAVPIALIPLDDLPYSEENRWAVETASGVALGTVFKQTRTRERKTAGRRYVNARWKSPPVWCYKPADSVRTSETYGDSRIEGVRRLVERAGLKVTA